MNRERNGRAEMGLEQNSHCRGNRKKALWIQNGIRWDLVHDLALKVASHNPPLRQRAEPKRCFQDISHSISYTPQVRPKQVPIQQKKSFASGPEVCNSISSAISPNGLIINL